MRNDQAKCVDVATYEQALAAYNRGHRDEAEALLRALLAAQPKHVPALVLAGAIAGQRLDLAGAQELLDRALAIEPENAFAHCNKAYVLLLGGEWQRGWPHYEWRRKLPDAKSAPAQPPRPLWLGREPLRGKTILLRTEQGFGDVLQFCRYVKPLARLEARVILEVPRALVALLADLPDVAQIVTAGKALPDFDYYCPLMSLPFAFNTSIEDVPCAAPYLTSDAGKTAEWQERLGERRAPLVGLVWSGSAANTDDRYRSVSLEMLYRSLPKGLCYVSLQKEVREEDRRTLQRHPEISSFAEEHHDFSDTAALAECMDVVVSVDTSVAHLCGALGKRTWILLQHCPSWRWLLGRCDSPWYSSVELFRQTSSDEWVSVCERVGARLQEAFAK